MNKENFSLGLLRQKREQLGLSIEEVVQKLDERQIKISSKTLYGYENGVGTPKVNTFIALCDIYGIDDILGAFGARSNVHIATDDSDWSFTLYNDFFNASLLDKIYILLDNGVPSFDGYEEQLSASLPDSAAAANFNKLYSLFIQLNETGQGAALCKLKEYVNDPDFSLSAQPQREDVG